MSIKADFASDALHVQVNAQDVHRSSQELQLRTVSGYGCDKLRRCILLFDYYTNKSQEETEIYQRERGDDLAEHSLCKQLREESANYQVVKKSSLSILDARSFMAKGRRKEVSKGRWCWSYLRYSDQHRWVSRPFEGDRRRRAGSWVQRRESVLREEDSMSLAVEPLAGPEVDMPIELSDRSSVEICCSPSLEAI